MVEKGAKYEFIVKGHISKNYFKEFGELDLISLTTGNTKLSGLVIDQAKLYSIISRFRDLGLELLVVKRNEMEGDQN